MTPNYVTDIQTLEDAGLADGQIAAILSSVTKLPIEIAAVENFLDFQTLAQRNPRTGAWEGRLPDVIDGGPEELAAGVSALFTHINKPRSTLIDTTKQPWATQAGQLLAGLVSAGVISEAHRDGFLDLGGGLRFGLVTPSDVADIRADHRRTEERLGALKQVRDASARPSGEGGRSRRGGDARV